MTSDTERAFEILADAGLPPDPVPSHRDLPDFDLGALLAEGIPAPEMLAGGMLYRGCVHTIAGQPGGGKTTLAAWWMLQHIREGGRVLLLDEESGPEIVAEKFADLGASPAELRPPRLSYVPFPLRSWNFADLAQLHDRIAERRPGIIAWDSVAAFLSISGRDENSAADVTDFWSHVLVPCARQHGAAVLALDHTGKSDHGGYGRGSGAKKAAGDVQYMLETVEPFSRSRNGLLTLTTSPGKDRRGYLADAYQVTVTVSPVLSLAITATSGVTGGTRQQAPAKLTPAESKILSVLSSDPVTQPEVTQRIAERFGHGLRRETVSRALHKLLGAGLADHLDRGPGRAGLWSVCPSLERDQTCDQTALTAQPPDLRLHELAQVKPVTKIKIIKEEPNL